MDPNDQENLNSQNETEESVNEEESHEEESYGDESEEEASDDELEKLRKENEDLKKENLTVKKQKEHWRTKAGNKKDSSKDGASDDSLSTRDLIAITSAQLHPDDVDEVLKASKLLNKSVSEAIKDPIVKAILEKRSEYRKTAQASNTKTTRSSVKKPDENTLKENLSKGIIPEKGSTAAEDLFWARRGGRR